MELWEFNELFKKYEDGTLSEDERRLLEKWYNQYAIESKEQPRHAELEKRLNSIAGKIPVRNQTTKIRRMYYRFAVAASVLIVVGIMSSVSS